MNVRAVKNTLSLLLLKGISIYLYMYSQTLFINIAIVREFIVLVWLVAHEQSACFQICLSVACSCIFGTASHCCNKRLNSLTFCCTLTHVHLVWFLFLNDRFSTDEDLISLGWNLSPDNHLVWIEHVELHAQFNLQPSWPGWNSKFLHEIYVLTLPWSCTLH